MSKEKNYIEEKFNKEHGDWDVYIKEMIQDIAKKNNAKAQILGPVGLRSEMCAQIQMNDEAYFAIFTPVFEDEGEENEGNLRLIVRYDTGEKSKGYAKGSVGEINGMNSITKRVTDELISTPIPENPMFFRCSRTSTKNG